MMNLEEIEAAIRRLPAVDLNEFAKWFEEYLADAWDEQLEADENSGQLDNAGQQAVADFEAGRCKPL